MLILPTLKDHCFLFSLWKTTFQIYSHTFLSFVSGPRVCVCGYWNSTFLHKIYSVSWWEKGYCFLFCMGQVWDILWSAVVYLRKKGWSGFQFHSNSVAFLGHCITSYYLTQHINVKVDLLCFFAVCLLFDHV